MALDYAYNRKDSSQSPQLINAPPSYRVFLVIIPFVNDYSLIPAALSTFSFMHIRFALYPSIFMCIVFTDNTTHVREGLKMNSKYTQGLNVERNYCLYAKMAKKKTKEVTRILVT